MEKLEEFLIQLGLSDKEAKIYLFLLTVDESNTAEISKKTRINRTTIYPVVDSLIEKGLVQEINRNEKNYVMALSPEKIETYVEEQKIKLSEQSKLVKDMVPKFKAIARGLGEKPIVEYYDGREGVLKSAINAFVGTNEKLMYLIYPRDSVEKDFTTRELEIVRNERIRRNIKVNTIYTHSKGEYASELYGDRMRIDHKKYTIKAEIGVLGNNVRIHIFGKNSGTIFIKSEDVAETIKTLFKLAFENHK